MFIAPGFADGEESDDDNHADRRDHRGAEDDDAEVEYVYAEEGVDDGADAAGNDDERDEEEEDEDETEMFKMFTDVKDALNPLNMIEKATGKKVRSFASSSFHCS